MPAIINALCRCCRCRHQGSNPDCSCRCRVMFWVCEKHFCICSSSGVLCLPVACLHSLGEVLCKGCGQVINSWQRCDQ